MSESSAPIDDSDNLLVYAIRFRPYAWRSLDAVLVYVADTCGKEGDAARAYAADFRAGFFTAMGTLATLPTRYAAAPEARYFENPLVRVMLYRYRTGGPAWRVFYRVFEADENDAAHVDIITLRHGAQKPLTRAEAKTMDAANR